MVLSAFKRQVSVIVLTEGTWSLEAETSMLQSISLAHYLALSG